MTDLLEQFLVNDDGDNITDFTELDRAKLLEIAEEIGNVGNAASEMRITTSQLEALLEKDPRLEDDLQMAIGRYQADVRRRIHDLAFNGYDKPVVGGKSKDQVICYETIPDPVALRIISQLHFNEDMAIVSRSNQKIDLKQPRGPVASDFSGLSTGEQKKLFALLKKAKSSQDALEGPNAGRTTDVPEDEDEMI